ncbi:TPA: GTP pyrophosphokinase family protein [Vibrio diabolicus]|uniref:GTP pyrophosphokinase n=1 Tax=Vibrio diabolicus TaxID=50719 RepID=UPI003F86943B
MKNYKDKIWKESPELIRGYYDGIEGYKLLCEEINYILKKSLSAKNIEVASISSRSKSLESFCEKIHRKHYQNPFESITDFAGARVVFLYEQDRESIEHIIESSFEIVEKVDKVQDSDVDQFGYGALHYIVKLKSNYVGERYNDIRNLHCEIQVRTILQDAWALVAHHLSYKQESDVPKHLRRKLNALSGLFETADNQFQHIRDARESYQSKVTDAIDHSDALVMSQEIELDSLVAFLKSKFPNRKLDDLSEISQLVAEIKSLGVNTLRQLDDILIRTEEARKQNEAANPPYDDENNVDTIYSATGETRQALEFVYDEFIDRFHESFATQIRREKGEFMHLVKRT